jgi:hypothetical protein
MRSRHHTKDKQRFVVSVVAYDSLPGHQSPESFSVGRNEEISLSDKVFQDDLAVFGDRLRVQWFFRSSLLAVAVLATQVSLSAREPLIAPPGCPNDLSLRSSVSGFAVAF